MKSGILFLLQEEPVWWVGYKSKYGPEWLSSGAPNPCDYRDQAGTLNRVGRNCGTRESLGSVARRPWNQLQPLSSTGNMDPTLQMSLFFKKRWTSRFLYVIFDLLKVFLMY